MNNMNTDFDRLKVALESPEGKKRMSLYCERLIARRTRLAARIERFHEKYKDNLDAVIERLMEKYYSEAYINKEYRLGYEPRETLLWLVFEYAQVYCKECTDEKYFNTFTAGAYYVGSYVIQLMVGQGSVLRIDRA